MEKRKGSCWPTTEQSKWTRSWEFEEELEEVQQLPQLADTLVIYPCLNGFVSFGSCFEGTWLVEALCETLDRFGHTREILEVMTVVNALVAKKSATNEEEDVENAVQTAYFKSSLRKKNWRWISLRTKFALKRLHTFYISFS